MANTRSSTKRAKQSLKKQARNRRNKSVMKTTLKAAVAVIKNKASTQEQVMQGLKEAARTLSKAASKGAIPKKRAARKISRLARVAKPAAAVV
jgi:small subunit ribosomal protein S20